MQRTWHLTLVWGPDGTSSLEAVSGKGENILQVWHQWPLQQSVLGKWTTTAKTWTTSPTPSLHQNSQLPAWQLGKQLGMWWSCTPPLIQREWTDRFCTLPWWLPGAMLLSRDTRRTQCYYTATQEEILCEITTLSYWFILHTSCPPDQYSSLVQDSLSLGTLNTLGPQVQMSKSPHLLGPYGNTCLLRPSGQVKLVCQKDELHKILTFQILPNDIMGNKPALLSGGDSERLDLVRIEADTIFSLSPSVTSDQCSKPCALQTSAQDTHTRTTAECNPLQKLHNNSPGTYNKPLLPSKPIRIPATRRLPPAGKLQKEHILAEYAANFEGLCCLGPPVHFTVKPGITPIQMPIHHIPVAKRSIEKSGFDKYEKAGIIEKVDKPTPWCANKIIRKTPRKVRICIDPSQTVNKAILCPLYQMPTLNEQLHKLCHTKCFSIIDMRESFLHIQRDEKSSRMTTMHTLLGRYQWRHLPFGILSTWKSSKCDSWLLWKVWQVQSA